MRSSPSTSLRCGSFDHGFPYYLWGLGFRVSFELVESSPGKPKTQRMLDKQPDDGRGCGSSLYSETINRLAAEPAGDNAGEVIGPHRFRCRTGSNDGS